MKYMTKLVNHLPITANPLLIFPQPSENGAEIASSEYITAAAAT